MKTEETKIGDVVEVQYGNTHTWDGIQFQVTECGPYYARGTVIKSPPTRKKYNPVGSEFTWGAGTGLILVEREGSMKTEKFTVGDIVQSQYTSDHQHARWNGLRLRISEIESKYTIKGVVLIAPSDLELARLFPVDKTMSWSDLGSLVIIKEDVAGGYQPMAWSTQEEPSLNQAYIDHLYERLTQNATKQELLNLAAKLEGFVTGMVVHPRQAASEEDCEQTKS